MESALPDTLHKALKINLDKLVYGTFAEIGAGQEVAHWFFKAGGAAGTVAKTMSAYDMTFSDAIYGATNRYVSRNRMEAMLTHEYDILLERLKEKRGGKTCFFVVADTVRARGFSDTEQTECHGWMGLRFQVEPLGPAHDVLMHVRLLEPTNREQADTLGVLGVNLLFSALYLRHDLAEFCMGLMDHLSRKFVEIDMITFRGPVFSHWEDRLCALQLVESGLTDAALFGANGEIWQAGDMLYKRPIFLKRGSFDPITKVNLDMLTRGEKAFKEDFVGETDNCLEVCELSMHNLLSGTRVDHEDFLARAEMLQELGKNVLVSKYAEFHRLSSYLARHTKLPVGIVLGLPLLEEIFQERWYDDLEGGILESFGRLFKNQVRVYVYPSGDALTNKIRMAKNARVSPHLQRLFDYLFDNQFIRQIEMEDNDPITHCIFQSSADIRQMIRRGDSNWREFVPDVVLDHGKWIEGAELRRRVSQTD